MWVFRSGGGGETGFLSDDGEGAPLLRARTTASTLPSQYWAGVGKSPSANPIEEGMLTADSVNKGEPPRSLLRAVSSIDKDREIDPSLEAD